MSLKPDLLQLWPVSLHELANLHILMAHVPIFVEMILLNQIIASCFQFALERQAQPELLA